MNLVKSKLLSTMVNVVHGFCDRRPEFTGSSITEHYGFSKMARLRQVHGSRVVIAEDRGFSSGNTEADAVITSGSGVLVAVSTADCVPVLLGDKKGRAVAAVHAGWRGTSSGVALNTLRVLRREFGIEPEDLLAAIGPSITKCCYEVSRDVASIFMNEFQDVDDYLFESGPGKFRLDLAAVNNSVLSKAGVRDIEVISLCTRCNENFYSYRREGKGVGGQLSFIGLR